MLAANPVEYLSLQAVRLLALPEKPCAAMLTVRLDPNESFASTALLLTPEQALRLRNDLNSQLHDPESWLYNHGDATSSASVAG